MDLNKDIFHFHKSQVFERYPQLKCCEKSMLHALEILTESYKSGGKLLIMGNGGSSADSEHLAGELMKNFLSPRKLTTEQAKLFQNFPEDFSQKLQGALPAISLGVSHSFLSAYMNDVDPDYIFAQGIWALSLSQDVVLGISTSGNSKNVVLGLKVAKAKGVKSIVLTGKKESECSQVADVAILAPENLVYKVQELHLPIYHALCIELERIFFDV